MISNYAWFHCLQKDFSKRITGVDPFGPKVSAFEVTKEIFVRKEQKAIAMIKFANF